VPAKGSNDDDVVNDETVGAGIQDIELSKHFRVIHFHHCRKLFGGGRLRLCFSITCFKVVGIVVENRLMHFMHGTSLPDDDGVPVAGGANLALCCKLHGTEARIRVPSVHVVDRKSSYIALPYSSHVHLCCRRVPWLETRGDPNTL
jgi:hypothetical protein